MHYATERCFLGLAQSQQLIKPKITLNLNSSGNYPSTGGKRYAGQFLNMPTCWKGPPRFLDRDSPISSFEYPLSDRIEWKEAYECKIYTFCLMTNHVHLVINPGENPENLGKLMKRIAGRQTRYINRQEGRSGTLWEARFKSSPIDSNGYLLACCRYVEMNPVVAGICADPADYPWSSCRSKVFAKEFEWLDLDPLYKSLAPLDDECRKRYR